MYIPKAHQFPQPQDIQRLMAAHPLGAWVCATDSGLQAHHLPFFLDPNRGPYGTLMGHVSRANPVWQLLNEGTPSVVMFQGPQAYITPGWYPGKTAHGRVVPTWNYGAVHAHGTARVVTERAWLLQMLEHLTNAQEAGRPEPWRVTDAPDDYINAMLQGIVGIEIPIARIEARLKASQDEDLQDRLGTVHGLQGQGGDGPQAMALWVEQAIRADKP